MKHLLILLIVTTSLQEVSQEIKPIDYLAALGWTILGIALIKAIIYPKGARFDLLRWLRENLQDVIIGLLACPIIMQLGAVLVGLAKYYVGFDTTGIEQALNEAHLSSIQLSLILSMYIQWKLFKRYQAKTNK